MKKSHVLILILMAAAVGVLISMTADFQQYTNFSEAMAQTDANHQIVGYLSTEKQVEYNPELDPNSFSFYMKDKEGLEKKVLCQLPKPQDFERSEEIVLIGRMDKEKDMFVAHDINLKCPSKYQDEAIQNANAGAIYN